MQLVSCRDSQLIKHAVPGQVSRRQLISVLWPVTDILLFLNKRKREKSTKDGREDRFYIWTVCIQSGHTTTWCLDSKNVWVGGGFRRYPYKFRYGVEE